MKVATILLAVAVATVSAEKPAASEPVNFREIPAVRSNLKEAGKDAFAAGAHATQGVLDIGREAHANVVAPTFNVASEGTKAAGNKGAGMGNRILADVAGTASAGLKYTGHGLRFVSEKLLNGAAASSRQFDRLAGAAEQREDLATQHIEKAKEPINRGVDNVKATAESAKDKAVEIKDRVADKTHAAKEEVKESAEDAKDSTKVAAHKSGNFISRHFHKGAAKTGSAVENVGEKIRDTGANLKEHESAKYEDARREKVVIEEKSSAMSIAAPGAAFAIAAATAAYLI